MPASKLPIEQRIDFYNRAMTLRNKLGWGSKRISRSLLEVPQPTIEEWVNRGTRPDTRFNKPDLGPSPELSYTIGVVLSDGGIYRNEIKLKCKDRDFAETFAKCLSTVVGTSWPIRTVFVYKPNHSNLYRTGACSKFLHDFLKSQKYDHIIKLYPNEFLRGLYDSDGNVHLFKDPRGRHLLRCQVRLANSNPRTIELVKSTLENFGFHPYVRKQGNCFSLELSRIEEVKRFCEEIGFSIDRKVSKLQTWLKERGKEQGARK